MLAKGYGGDFSCLSTTYNAKSIKPLPKSEKLIARDKFILEDKKGFFRRAFDKIVLLHRILLYKIFAMQLFKYFSYAVPYDLLESFNEKDALSPIG